MSPDHVRKIVCYAPLLASTDWSCHNPLSLPFSGLCRCRPLDGSAMTETGRFTFGVLCLFLQNYRHASLQKPLAGRPCLLADHLPDQLARKAMSLGPLRFFCQV